MITAGQQIASQANANKNKDVFGNIYFNAKAYGLKGNGVTDDANAFNALILLVSFLGGGIILFPPGTYFLGTAINAIDVSKISLQGNNAAFHFSVNTGNCLTFFSSTSYSDSYRNSTFAIYGIDILGGSATSPLGSVGIFIGSGVTIQNCFFTFQNISIQGFARNIKFGDNAFKVSFQNMISRWGGIEAPQSITNSGENMSFINCFFADDNILSNGIYLGIGEWHFLHCSFDNITLRSTGDDGTVTCTQCHFENPGATASYRYAQVENDRASLYLNDCVFILNPTITWDRALISISDTNVNQGIIFKNLKLFQSGSYQPWLTDTNAVIVAGKGRVQAYGTTMFENFNGFAIASSFNSLYNGDAEIGTLSGWTVTGTGTATIDSVIKHSGTKSFKLTATAGQNVTFIQKFRVKPQQYLLSQFWRQFTAGAGSTVSTKIEFYSQNDTLISSIGFQQDSATLPSFTLNRSTVGTVPAGTDYALLQVFLNGSTGGGTFWLDDVIMNLM